MLQILAVSFMYAQFFKCCDDESEPYVWNSNVCSKTGFHQRAIRHGNPVQNRRPRRCGARCLLELKMGESFPFFTTAFRNTVPYVYTVHTMQQATKPLESLDLIRFQAKPPHIPLLRYGGFTTTYAVGQKIPLKNLFWVL